MKHALIFDIGMHRGEDTAYYLSKGYSVVAVDADPKLVESAKQKFSNAVKANQLRLENLAVAEHPGEIDFYISKNTIWNSINHDVADRLDFYQEKISIPADTLNNLFKKHGVPLYCKIDIEGYDIIAIKGLSKDLLPEYISVESECLAEGDELTDVESLATLNQLHALGYRHFKLVDQHTLQPLKPHQAFYKARKAQNKYIKKIKRLFSKTYRQKLGTREGYIFPSGASGPFGEGIDGEWYSYDEAKAMLLHHRGQFFHNHSGKYNFSFWCDWHAKK